MEIAFGVDIESIGKATEYLNKNKNKVVKPEITKESLINQFKLNDSLKETENNIDSLIDLDNDLIGDTDIMELMNGNTEENESDALEDTDDFDTDSMEEFDDIEELDTDSMEEFDDIEELDSADDLDTCNLDSSSDADSIENETQEFNETGNTQLEQEMKDEILSDSEDIESEYSEDIESEYLEDIESEYSEDIESLTDEHVECSRLEEINKEEQSKESEELRKQREELELLKLQLEREKLELEKERLRIEKERLESKKAKIKVEEPKVENNKIDITDDKKEKQKELVNDTDNEKSEQDKKEIDYKKYSSMEISSLYRLVKNYMLNNGVQKKPLEIEKLDERFGAENIRKLVRASYLIVVKKGVTIGI